MDALVLSIMNNTFRKKEVEHWNRLYKRFNCSMCPSRKREFLVDLRANGSKYFACADYQGRHMCAVVPIAIGSNLDIEIQSSIIAGDHERIKQYQAILDFFFGTLLNFGFYSHFPKYMINNNKQFHKYKHANQEPMARAFFYDVNNYGHMIYMDPDGELVLRLPTTEEYTIFDDHLLHRLSNEKISNGVLNEVLENNKPKRAQIDFEAFKRMFTLKDALPEIDDIASKIVLSAAILIEGLLTAMFCTEDVKKIKAIKQAITSGNLFIQMCKKESNNNTRKSQKEVARFIGKNKTKSLYIERQMYVNIDETVRDCAFNQIKRSNSKHSKFIPYDVPTNSMCIISPYYCANMTKASKNLLLANGASITFVDSSKIDAIFNVVESFSTDSEDGMVIVINSVPTTLRVPHRRVLALYVRLKVEFGEVKINQIGDFFFIIWQSGLLQFPLQVQEYCGEHICSCGTFIANNEPGEPSESNIKSTIPPSIPDGVKLVRKQIGDRAQSCSHHFLVDHNEIKMLERLLNYKNVYYYYQIMDHNSLEIARYVQNTPLFKTITAVKTARNRYATKEAEVTGNKELTKGICTDRFIDLFTIFYDYKGGTVGDGYVLNRRLRIPFKHSVKQTLTFSAAKDRVHIQRICTIARDTIRVCKIYSETALEFKQKRMHVQEYQKSNKCYIYIVLLPLNSSMNQLIDPSSICVGSHFVKRRINLYVTYNTFYSPKTQIKMSNSFGQKGMCSFRDLDHLTTESGRMVEVASNPPSILKRQAFGQIKDMTETERVYDNGVYIGIGGVCRFFLVDTFPHDEIYCGSMGSPMKYDQLTYISSLGNNNARVDSELERPYDETPSAHIQKILELTKMVGKSVEYGNHHTFLY